MQTSGYIKLYFQLYVFKNALFRAYIHIISSHLITFVLYYAKYIQMRTLLSLVMILAFSMAAARESIGGRASAQQPIGWASCATHDGGHYRLSGGAGGRDTVLYSHGTNISYPNTDMYATLTAALERFDRIVLDGKNGPFVLSQRIALNGLKHKTIEGRNDAQLQTAFVVDAEIRHMLDTAQVKRYSSMSKDGEVFTLSNGRTVKEACEYQVRQHMINYLGDVNENYRMSGIFSINGCEDIILRNLTMQGPGAVDVSGKDVLTIGEGSHHIWIDHCDFMDGMDGNFDITTRADFITVSHCTFSYTDRSYMHQNTNLIGSSDNAEKNGDECLNVTYDHCVWGHGCDQRMPMVRFGKVHLLNCVFDCPDCRLTVNPRIGSEVLMEGCVWKKGVKRIFSANNAKAYQFRDCIFEEQFNPKDLGTVTLPYRYKAESARKLNSKYSKQQSKSIIR